MTVPPRSLRHCPICARKEPGGARGEAVGEEATVLSNVRRFKSESFTVWRCARCRSLHSLQDIDYARYYEDYPMQRQPLDFFARRLFASRLACMTRAGLTARDSVLDYGCGNGVFVRFLRERGFAAAQGFDPYSHAFADRAVLAQVYDCVTSQDVIEHVPDPHAFLDEVASLVRRPGGMLAIGTPDAEHIDLRDPVDHVGQLHQPHHRHILAGRELVRMVEERAFRVVRIVPRFYVDTWFPFANSSFLFRYMAAVDGTVDAGFDPIRFDLIVRSPRLLWYGLFGRLHRPRKDILVIAVAR
jgi:2-polyprenyl-3-methyl-5-hydroxy-6-metoxy-1,4-benzoquinol methylase